MIALMIKVKEPITSIALINGREPKCSLPKKVYLYVGHRDVVGYANCVKIQNGVWHLEDITYYKQPKDIGMFRKPDIIGTSFKFLQYLIKAPNTWYYVNEMEEE